ncbi:hypothetical protein OHT52_31085 [Streptomyces sp. NBC_00247]|uniref:hypothetical protein n=1 Tax=Streptomyces sp. NBC_00247 TaxID=2975689 RepID=UPI002E2D7158|nr:hypothetical protein [Streptomyces sp. NBC_00247]
MRPRFRPMALLAAAVTSVASCLLFATPASAGVADATCLLGTETTTYSPPVTLTPQSVHINTVRQLGPCLSTNPAITTGTMNISFNATRSCLTVASPSTATLTINWNNGQTSTLLVNYVNNNAAGQIVSVGTGAVTAGLFAGDSAVVVNVGPTLDTLNCALNGISSRTGTFTLELTSL